MKPTLPINHPKKTAMSLRNKHFSFSKGLVHRPLFYFKMKPEIKLTFCYDPTVNVYVSMERYAMKSSTWP